MAFNFPSSPAIGDTANGYKWDGTAWIVIGSDGGDVVSEAPIDGTPYERKDAAWVSATGASLPAPVANAMIVRDHANSAWLAVPLEPNASDRITRRRVYSNTKRVADYLAADPLVDQTAFRTAFNTAMGELVDRGTVELPGGSMFQDAAITLRHDINWNVEGGYYWGSRILATPALGASPMFTAAGALSQFRWNGGALIGNLTGLTGLGFAAEAITHSVFENMVIFQMNQACIRANNGYCNTFKNLQLYSNAGGGLDLSGVNVNANVVHNNKIYANGGIGILLGMGEGNSVVGNTLEHNKQAAIMAYSIGGLDITGNYFERNCETGYAYTSAGGSPENVTVKSDIHLLHTGRQIYPAAVPPDAVEGVVIEGNMFAPFGTDNFPTPGLSQDSIVFAPSLRNAVIKGNHIRDITKISGIVGLYNDSARCVIGGAEISLNTNNDVTILGAATGNRAINTAHLIHNQQTQNPLNYAPATRVSYIALAGATGTLADNGTNYGPHPVWKLTPGDILWGVVLDLNLAPELRGKHVWFGVNYQVKGVNDGLQLYCGGHTTGVAAEAVTAAGVWKSKSSIRKIGAADASLVYAFVCTGADAAGVLIARPMLTLVGNSFTETMRV